LLLTCSPDSQARRLYLFEVMRIALLTKRISRNDANPGLRPQPEDMLEDATQGGARAVQQIKLLGSLDVGKKADLIVLDTQRARLVPAGASCPRGFTMVNRPTSSPAWSTGNSSCGIVRFSRWTSTASSPKPARLVGESGTRCWKQALFRCRADRAGSDNHAGLISSAISHGPQEFVKISRMLEVAKLYALTALELMAKATT